MQESNGAEDKDSIGYGSAGPAGAWPQGSSRGGVPAGQSSGEEEYSVQTNSIRG